MAFIHRHSLILRLDLSWAWYVTLQDKYRSTLCCMPPEYRIMAAATLYVPVSAHTPFRGVDRLNENRNYLLWHTQWECTVGCAAVLVLDFRRGLASFQVLRHSCSHLQYKKCRTVLILVPSCPHQYRQLGTILTRATSDDSCERRLVGDQCEQVGNDVGQLELQAIFLGEKTKMMFTGVGEGEGLTVVVFWRFDEQIIPIIK